jgi:hypothetical protein
LFGRLIDRRECAAAGGHRRASGAECRQRLPARRPVVAAIALQRIARFDQRGQIAGECLFVGVGCRQQHRRQTRVRAEREQLSAEGGDVTGCVQRVQSLQQFLRSGHGAARRSVNKAQRAVAPGGKFQAERGQLGLGDFRRAHRFESLRLRPQSITESFRHAAGTAGALIGGGLRNVYCFQSRKTGVRIKTRFAREPRVDDRAHAGQSDRRFGDVGGEHDAAAALRIG